MEVGAEECLIKDIRDFGDSLIKDRGKIRVESMVG